ncbi:hypothetical protein CRYUN_Cryun05aG0041600 [Craigia yunnanensis]
MNNRKHTMEAPTEEFFEPYCQWKKGIVSDVIDIELYGFKTEDLKVTRKPIGEGNTIISLIAESPRRLAKEIEISNDYDLEKVRAKFYSGNLSLELPKKAASNKLEISMPKLEIRKVLKESAEDMQVKIVSAVEYSYSKKEVAAFGLMLLATVFIAYKYYTTECYGVEK